MSSTCFGAGSWGRFQQYTAMSGRPQRILFLLKNWVKIRNCSLSSAVETAQHGNSQCLALLEQAAVLWPGKVRDADG